MVGGRVEVAIDPNGRPVGFVVPPNDVIVPAGTYWTLTVSAKGADGLTHAWTRPNCVITTSPDPVAIGALNCATKPGINDSIDADSDVDTSTTPPTNGQTLIWDSTAKQWEPGSGGSGHTVRNGTSALTARTNLSATGGLRALDNGGQNSSDLSIDPNANVAIGNGLGVDGKWDFTGGRVQVPTYGTCVGGLASELCLNTALGRLQLYITGAATSDIPSSFDFTTKGDMIAATGNNAFARLPAGANGARPVADSTQTNGYRFQSENTNGVSFGALGALNFSDTNPGVPLNGLNVKWQYDLGTGDRSAYVPMTQITKTGTLTQFNLNCGTCGVTAGTVTANTLIVTDGGDGTRKLGLTDNTTSCPDPAALDTNICTKAGVGYIRDTGGPDRKILDGGGGDFGDFTCTSGTCTVDASAAPLTTKGDIYTRDATANARLAVGSNGAALTADSTATTGNKWSLFNWQVFHFVTGLNSALGPGSGMTLTSTRIYCTHAVIPPGTQLAIDSFVYDVNTVDPNAGANIGTCIYNADGTSLLNSAFGTAGSSLNAGSANKTIAIAQTLGPGEYNMCFTSNSSVASLYAASNRRPANGTRYTGYIGGGGTSCPASIAYPFTNAFLEGVTATDLLPGVFWEDRN